MSLLDNDYSNDFDEDMVSIRPEGSRFKKVLIALAVLLLIGIVLLFVGRAWVSSQLDPAGEPTGEAQILVEKGATTGDIANQLEEAEVVPDSFFFRYYTRWNNVSEFQAGEYTLMKNMSAEEAVAAMQEGPRAIEVATIKVKEGAWISEILPDLAQQLPNATEDDFRQVLDDGQLKPRYRPEDQTSWEGYLFPNTYEVNQDATALEVLGVLNNEFAKVSGKLGYGRSDLPNNLTPYEVLVVASLVEAEAKTDGDRPKIARVIYNRLDENEWLGIDASLIYESQQRGVVPTQGQIDAETEYNTRAPAGTRGLPPTPIGVPSEASMRAALQPADGDWFYYVLADAEGNHLFTADEAEFLRQKDISGEQGLL